MISRPSRIYTYLHRMFPPWVMVPMAVAHFLAIYWTLQAGAGHSPVVAGYRAVGGVVTVLLFSLLLRVYDEFKDFDADRHLGALGDPRYRDRPTVTGAVLPSDLVVLRNAVLLGLVAVNVLMWHATIMIAFALLLGLAWISSRWFFMPGMRNNLLLALLTHNPLGLALEVYIVVIAYAEGYLSSVAWWVVLLLLGLWLPITAWELSRKIRVPEDETQYQTYSKWLGHRRAALAPAAVTVVSLACLVSVILHAGLGTACLVAVVAAGGAAVVRYVQFAAAPNRARAQLRPWAELYAGTANIALAVAAGWVHGVRWAG